MKFIAYSEIWRWLEGLSRDMEVFVPTVRQGGDVGLAPIGTGKFTLDYRRLSESPKRLLFPQVEEMFRFRGNEVEGSYEGGARMLFGIRPCDAAAVATADAFFRREPPDPYYVGRRRETVLVVVACSEPDEGCFCPEAGTGPVARFGFDLQLFPAEDGFWVQVGSERGEEVLSEVEDLPDGEEYVAGFEEDVLKKFEDMPDLKRASKVLKGDTEGFWSEVEDRCITCGGCTYICPTCTCFDFYDWTTGEQGERIRTWDSCVFAGFTREASGHNPRPSQGHRLRRWFEHKLTGSEVPHLLYRCVGCGRCERACPGGIGMRPVVEELVKWSA